MAIARPILGLTSLIILAGGIVMQFLVVLSGTHIRSPENQIYFLQASTHGVTGGGTVRNPSRWTFFSVCGVLNGLNANCGAVVPALPFDPPRNFGTTNGVAVQFIGTHKYYYLSRFMFAFYLIALFFAVIAFFFSILALCSRIGAYLTGLNTMIAFFFQTLAASLMTAWVIQGRHAFLSNNQASSVGVKAMAFTWAAFACFFVSTVLFCVGGRLDKSDSSSSKKPFGGYFRRKRSSRSRGSFIDNESQQRVKDEYD